MKKLIPAFALLTAFASNAFASNNVTFDFNKIEVPQALQLLSDYKKQNIVISPDVSGFISMKLTDVTWDEALDYVLQAADLQSSSSGDVIIVKPKNTDSDRAEIVTYPATYIQLKHVLPSDIVKVFHLYPDEFLLPSDDLSMLTAHLSSNRLKELNKLVSSLDVYRAQILIEARIVEVNRDYLSSLGVNWTNTAIDFGRLTIAGSSVLSAPSPVALGLGYVSSSFSLDSRLNAMETDGKGTIVSSPKIFVFDRKKARISKGFQIPYQELQGDGVVTTSFKDASLALDVLPRISGGYIVVDLDLSKDEPDFSKNSTGQPAISTSSFTSSVRLSSGETVAIGGVFSDANSDSSNRVPVLSKIPLIGKAFSYRSKKKTNSELFLFLTATLVE